MIEKASGKELNLEPKKKESNKIQNGDTNNNSSCIVM